MPLVPKDATLVHFADKEGCNIDEDSILEALIAKIARIKFENEAKEAWTTNRNGIFDVLRLEKKFWSKNLWKISKSAQTIDSIQMKLTAKKSLK